VIFLVGGLDKGADTCFDMARTPVIQALVPGRPGWGRGQGISMGRDLDMVEGICLRSCVKVTVAQRGDGGWVGSVGQVSGETPAMSVH
jgi:hypothetical protein